MDLSFALAAASHQSDFRPDWGDVPTWIGSVTSTCALIAAVVAAVAAHRVYEIESRRDATAADERRVRFEAERRAQADKVAAWYAWKHHESSGSPDPATFRLDNGWRAFVRNASDLPIYDVDVDFYYVHPNAGPGHLPVRRGSGDQFRVVPPLEEVHAEPPEGMLRQTDSGGRSNYAVAIEFRDAAGTRWRRDIDGKLTDLTPADSAPEKSEAPGGRLRGLWPWRRGRSGT